MIFPRQQIALLALCVLSLPVASTRGDGIPGSGVADFYYNMETGAAFLDTDGATPISMLIEGPQAQAIDRFDGLDPQTGTTWIQSYYDGKEQWIDVSLTGVQGEFKIASYEPGLAANDFLSVEYGTAQGGTHFTHVTRILFAADFTRDGTVDADDLARWQSDFGTYSPHSDANNNGVTDGQDFLIWQRQFGSGPTPTMHAIPEPPSILLLCLGQILAGRLGVGRKSAHDRSWSAFLANNVDKI